MMGLKIPATVQPSQQRTPEPKPMSAVPAEKVTALPVKSVEKTEKKPAAPKKPAVKKPSPVIPKVTAARRKSAGQIIAAIGAGFLPIASYELAHYEVANNPWLWALVVAGLAFSAPTLAEWATKWCRGSVKAWGFTVLLEGVMIASSNTVLALVGLGILVAINSHSAWVAAAEKPAAQ